MAEQWEYLARNLKKSSGPAWRATSTSWVPRAGVRRGREGLRDLQAPGGRLGNYQATTASNRSHCISRKRPSERGLFYIGAPRFELGPLVPQTTSGLRSRSRRSLQEAWLSRNSAYSACDGAFVPRAGFRSFRPLLGPSGQ